MEYETSPGQYPSPSILGLDGLLVHLNDFYIMRAAFIIQRRITTLKKIYSPTFKSSIPIMYFCDGCIPKVYTFEALRLDSFE